MQEDTGKLFSTTLEDIAIGHWQTLLLGLEKQRSMALANILLRL